MTLDPETNARIEAEEAYRAQVRRTGQRKGFWEWAAVLIGVPIAVLAALAIWGSLAPSTPDYQTSFLVACQRGVREKLKAPSTAKFGNEIGRDVLTVTSGYRLNGTIEAQNSFGALIQSTYQCTGSSTNLEIDIE
ncbi:hypothetical protein [Deinococcus marmoris]|uniref:Uncharacterized protein n=1 Tax=Deinococcus marmoris TaxID=249408 RepID=A0A1U7P4X9_9DEIO|nr:hypothetical protein [Deinococcus marmoris]OLV20108.1 hypothetical protein BOO71_0000352 [Deinococcus marmoris]OLV20235.1 hypothetical protein BOO71_0000733 [Deinococcus marmoris]